MTSLMSAPLEAPDGPPARSLPGLSVVLPCYNEALNVAQAILAAATAAAAASERYEVIVVDDGSSDETATIAASFADAGLPVRVVVHARNRGYGQALRSGIDAARMPWILMTDADLQFDLHEIQDFLPHTADADFLMGWRMQRKDPIGRRANAAAWNWLVRRVFRLQVRDVDCAFKLIRRDILEGVELTSTGAMISTELLVKCLARGARLKELGVHHHPRVAGEQSGANPRVVARAFRELATLWQSLHGPSPAATG